MRTVIICIISLFLFGTYLQAQDKNMTMADSQYEQGDYVAAIKSYKKALRKTDDFELQKEIAEQIAFSYYAMNDYDNAQDWFADAIGHQSSNIDAYLCYAEILAIKQQFYDAKSILEKASLLDQKNETVNKRLQSLQWLILASKTDSLKLFSLVEALNSSSSDYGLAWWNEYLVFASTRGGQETDGRTGQAYSELYYSSHNSANDQWASVRKMNAKFRSSENDGAFSFDSKHQIAYWTRCTGKTKACKIYQSQYSLSKKQWLKAEAASFMNESYHYGHPYPSANGQTLYFTSNMPGGFGKNDIWKISRKSDGQWGIPVNLGENINSAANEVFPSQSGDSLLFFSSDKDGGLGRLDMYISMQSGISYSPAINLGYPLNGAADDFSLLMNQKGDGGYFCSNRNTETSDGIYTFKGFPVKLVLEGEITHCLDDQALGDVLISFTNNEDVVTHTQTNDLGHYVHFLNAFDSYRMTVSEAGYHKEERLLNTTDVSTFGTNPPQFVINFELSKTIYPCAISGEVVNRDGKHVMEGVTIEIWNDAGYATYRSTDANGNYHFDDLKPNTIYHIRSSFPGYFSESRDIRLPKVDHASVFSKSTGYDMDFELTKIQTQNEVILSNIYYDLNKASLRTSSKVELQKLASMLKETPEVVIQVNAHTDSRGKPSYNLKLSARRAQAVIDYLVELGIGRERLIAKGYGESQPLITNAQIEEEHQANRRTSFKVVEFVEQDDIVKAEPGHFSAGPSYRLQLLSTSNRRHIEKDFNDIHSSIPGLQIYEHKTAAIYKYEVGNRKTLAAAKKLQLKLEDLGYSDCFVVSYLGEKKISIEQAKKLEAEVH